MSGFRFEDPLALLLLALGIAALWTGMRLRRSRRPALLFSASSETEGLPRGVWARLRPLLHVVEAAVVVLVVIALARPQSGLAASEVYTEGVDIVLVLDTSGSMRAEDFQPRNRLQVAKETVGRFIQGRRNDRIGLVVFAEAAYTKVPLTLDYELLLRLLDGVEIDRRSGKTAIGMALATGVNRLRRSPTRSRVIVLLTDGRSNAGLLTPEDAAELAAELGIRVYTIGVGSKGPVPFPVDDPVLGTRYTYQAVDIDEPSLRDIARRTGGIYFRATDEEALAEIFRKIDALEKTEVKVKHYERYAELFPRLLGPGAILLALGLLLGETRMRTVP